MKEINQIPLSVLDLAIIIDGKTAKDSFANSLDLAQHAEHWGYKRFWLAEHHNMPNVASTATSVLIGYIANGTSSIRVGSGGVMLPNHAPLIIAEQFGTLATLFPNRIDLGLGRAPGTSQLTVRALRRDLNAGLSFPEDVQELQLYLSEGNKNGLVRSIPGEGTNIPIWILGSSTDSAYLAAALGLPYAFASHFAPAQLLQAIDIYRNNFKPSQNLAQPYVMPCVNIVAADKNEEAELLATSTQQMFWGILTNDRKPLQKPDKNFKIDPRAAEALAQMSTYAMVGNQQSIKQQLNNFLNLTQADEIMVVSHIYDHQARLRSYELIHEYC